MNSLVRILECLLGLRALSDNDGEFLRILSREEILADTNLAQY